MSSRIATRPPLDYASPILEIGFGSGVPGRPGLTDVVVGDVLGLLAAPAPGGMTQAEHHSPVTPVV